MNLRAQLFYLFLLSIYPLQSQNLVPNPSFEKVNRITNHWVPSDYIFEERIEDWTTPNLGSPDIFFDKVIDKITPPRKGVDLSPHLPRTGHMMIGIKTYGCETYTQHCKEYLQIKLKEKIKAGEEYFVEFWVNPMSTSIHVNNIGAAFADVEIQDNSEYGIYYFDPLVNEKNVIANAPNEWHRVAATVTANEDAQYLLLGNFFTDEETQVEREADDIRYSYYFIDDVLVRPLHATTDDWSADDMEIGNTIQLNDILFQTNEAKLLPASFRELQQLAKLLQEKPELVIRINGHTDNQGEEDYNLTLSEKRAEAVVQYLVQKGISEERLQFRGFGETQPMSSNDTAEGQKLNRRVEFVILEE